MAARLIHFKPRLAIKAAVALSRDPDDLPQVFSIIEALSFTTLSRIAARFAESAAGRKLLEDRPDIVDKLADRAWLASLPEGSVGREYLAFVTRENISADGIRAASLAGTSASSYGALPSPHDYVYARMRDTHDLWHVVTGFQGDVLGETVQLAFILAQTQNPAIALIIAVAYLKLTHVREARSLIRTWFARGRKATWLPTVHWEALLARPLDEVRRELGITEIASYTPVRSSELDLAA